MYVYSWYFLIFEFVICLVVHGFIGLYDFLTENRNEKVQHMHSIMANLNLDRDVAKKEKENKVYWPTLIVYSKL